MCLPLAIAARTAPVPRLQSTTHDEASYVIQGMEFKLGLADFVQEDVIRILHTFSELISQQSEFTRDLDTLAHSLGDIQREFMADTEI